YLRARTQRMIVRHQAVDIGFLNECFLDARMAAGAMDEADVDPVLRDHLTDLAGHADGESDLYFRMADQEVAHRACDGARAQRGNCQNVDLAASRLLQRFDLGAKEADLIQEPFRLV